MLAEDGSRDGQIAFSGTVCGGHQDHNREEDGLL